MKTKTLFIALILAIFVPLVSSCSPGNEEQPVSRFISNQATAVIPQSGPTDPLELENFLDAYFAEQMPALHVPGATFVLVKDGEILLAKGYGYADLENQVRYHPDETVFWAASIAKIFSVVGVLQLYEQGLIHLEDDVNRYLVDFQIPDDYPQPIPPPGRFLTYGNYGTNLAGVLVEDISGMPFAAYMDTNIFRPLEMNRTTFEQTLPLEWTPDLAVGYGYRMMTQCS